MLADYPYLLTLLYLQPSRSNNPGGMKYRSFIGENKVFKHIYCRELKIYDDTFSILLAA